MKLTEQDTFDSKSPESDVVLQRFETISEKIDMIYERDTAKIELYLQNDNNSLITRVSNYENVPESIYASFNLCRNELAQIIYIEENPFSESGDWNLKYENYFDESGNLIAFIRKCSFFNGICAEIVHERSQYFYDSNHKLVKKTYEIKDENNKSLEANKCIFNYNVPYKQYMTLEDYLSNYSFEER